MSQAPDTFGCNGTSMKVAAGHYFDLRLPSASAIEIQSIAASLSKLCRYGGHCPNFYSVAEHCVLATNLAASDGHTGQQLQAVFLHDAAEAYTGDAIKPFKMMMREYSTVEMQIEDAASEAFGVDFLRWAGTIQRYDRAMLKAEKLAFWPEDKEQWQGLGAIETRHVNFQFWDHREAEVNYLAMARTLGLCSPETRVLRAS